MTTKTKRARKPRRHRIFQGMKHEVQALTPNKGWQAIYSVASKAEAMKLAKEWEREPKEPIGYPKAHQKTRIVPGLDHPTRRGT